MTTLFQKLNYKGYKEIFCLNEPEEFLAELEKMTEYADVKFEIKEHDVVSFFIGFAIKKEDIVNIAFTVIPRLSGDAVFWICYPKSSSKKYKCEFNRDTGWEAIGKHEMEGVRMVAIDENWSALRFRNTKYIKNFTRKFDALSKSGKEKQKNND